MRSNTSIQYQTISDPEILIETLEKLREQDASYIFRGQPNDRFYLRPKAFRQDGFAVLQQEFPVVPYQEWYFSTKIKELILLYLKNEALINSVFIKRLCELTIYTMQYNYALAKFVQKNEADFDLDTIKKYKLRSPSFWITKEFFDCLFGNALHLSIGRIALDGTVINYSIINEEFTCYDDSLPQHYGVPTAGLDWTRNPLIAIYFALENIPKDASHFSIYAYKEIQQSKKNPIVIEPGHPECKNLRIICQEGCFTRFRYACLYYFICGCWPCMEDYISISEGNFDIIRYDVSVCHAEYLKNILDGKGITKEYLLLNE